MTNFRIITFILIDPCMVICKNLFAICSLDEIRKVLKPLFRLFVVQCIGNVITHNFKINLHIATKLAQVPSHHMLHIITQKN